MARSMQGTVVSDKADKTIVVAVQTRKTHPVYKKQYTVTKKFSSHDAHNDAHVGDRVEIIESRPLSATKRFTLNKILERASVVHSGEADVEVIEEVTKKSKQEVNTGDDV